MNREFFIDLFKESKELVELEMKNLEERKSRISGIEYLEKSSYYKGKLHVIDAYLDAIDYKGNQEVTEMKFTKEEIQKVVDGIQKTDKTPEFMLVTVDSGFYVDSDNTLRDEVNEMAFYTTCFIKRDLILLELAKSLIEQSL